MKCRGINYSKKKINCSVLSNTALQVPLGLLKNIITVIKNEKSKKKKRLTLGDFTNIAVQVSPTCTITTTKKHAPSAITVQLVDESRVVFTTWFSYSPFANSQRSSIHQVQFPAFFVKPILYFLEWLFLIFLLPISSLMIFHSCSVSMETRSPPRLWQMFLFKRQGNPSTEIIYQEFLKVILGHSI